MSSYKTLKRVTLVACLTLVLCGISYWIFEIISYRNELSKPEKIIGIQTEESIAVPQDEVIKAILPLPYSWSFKANENDTLMGLSLRLTSLKKVYSAEKKLNIVISGKAINIINNNLTEFEMELRISIALGFMKNSIHAETLKIDHVDIYGAPTKVSALFERNSAAIQVRLEQLLSDHKFEVKGNDTIKPAIEGLKYRTDGTIQVIVTRPSGLRQIISTGAK